MKKYIEKAKTRQKVSQNKLAEMIGITKGRLSQIAGGDSTPQELIIKIARLAGEKPEKVLADYELARPHTEEVRRMWERISGHAAMVLLSVTATLSVLAVTVSNVPKYILC